MRLERRLMLSGDFGDMFEIEDDFEEIDGHYDSAFDDEHDDDEHDDDEHEYYDDEYDVDSRDNEAFFVPVSDLIFSSFSNVDEEDEIEVDELEDERTSVSSSLDDDLSSAGPAEDSQSSQSDKAGLLVGALRVTSRSADHLSGKHSQDSRFLNDRDIAFFDFEANDPTKTSEPDDGILFPAKPVRPSSGIEFEGVVAPVETNPAPDISPESAVGVVVQHRFRTDSHLSDVDALNAPAIAWLGSFADDLSAFDEALRDFIGQTRETAVDSIYHAFQPGPIVVVGAAATGVATARVFRRIRTRQSELENDFYSTTFDVRLYPELFGHSK